MNQNTTDQQLDSKSRFLVKNTLECIWTYDIQAEKFTFISPAILKLSGYTVSEAMRLSLADLLPKDSLENAKAIIQLLLERYIQGERREETLTCCNDYDLLCKDKTIKQVEITAKIIHNDESGFIELIGIVWDITQRKQHEKYLNQTLENKNEMISRLRDSEQALKGFIEELHQKNLYLQTRATRDALTGIFNRYYFDQKVTEESERCRRYGFPLSIMLFDIDHFKSINDMHGHQIGDRVLINVAGIVNKTIRMNDTFARWGGDEFAILLPQAALSEAKIVAEKIRRNIEEYPFKDCSEAITASFGVVEFMHGEAEESWFRRVDYALLRSKSGGRNYVTAMNWEAALPFVHIELEWKSEWASGNTEIDIQHKALLALGNKLLSKVLQNMQSADTANALTELIAYIRMHSACEEEILRKIGYPDTEQHAEIHQKLFWQMEELQTQYQEGKLTSSSIFTFVLDDVVIGHQCKEDVRYFAYLKNHGFASATAT